ncbi:Gfo/Idh/MocA family protein [Actibacterium sp. 188UL27-1]|uniref:Gfo/Idh/MocA family protein n=1 Tax=Actibacterium sp. 188UL27-1 TaxID=2786961 RepID=UPI00195D979B|nr:Gfo/Idh/MocA family oxidoreductase [Actibacterium sp. 188UL27-1]MBM7066841.1 Gfo/Idh/MocA family oxidoreductase [Actibacterium sp. 188UL27-1]
MKQVALIGLGMVAATHVQAIQASGAVTLRGVLSRDADRARAFLEQQDVAARVYGDLAALAGDPALDFVIVATPPDARLEIVQALVATGKPILLEKPIERTAEAAAQIVGLCRDMPLGIVFQHRKRPAAMQLMDLVDRGALGALAAIEIAVPWWRPQSYYDVPGRGTYARDGGGVLLTQAIHTMELALRLTGPVARVQAMARTTALHTMEAEDFVVAGLEFASGAVGSLTASTASFPGGAERIALHGAQGSAILDAASLSLHWQDGRSEIVGQAADTGGGADPMAFTADWHRGIIEDFAACLETGRDPCVTGVEALHVHRLIDAIQVASREKRFVEVGDG